MICSNVCACGIISNSLQISGSGGQGDPWQIESNAFGVVTSTTRPSSPFVGQSIFETDTQRYRVWDGTFWVIMGGAFPSVTCTTLLTDTPQAISDVTSTQIVFVNEVVDSDSFHTGTTGVFTVPAGLGGDYVLSGSAQFASNIVGYRLLQMNVTANTTTTKELPDVLGTEFPTAATNNVVASAAMDVRLEAGAVVTFLVYQSSGGPLNMTRAKGALRMTRHIPSLT